MASIKNCVKVCQELRPCIVNGQKGLFHCWEQRSEIVPPSPMKGGHSGGIIKYILGIVELEDGSIHKCYPDEIKFADNKIAEYAFVSGTR